jgi:threonine/homoserine/homoserine lactone efflux protein
MLQSALTILIIGFTSGFIFAMPIAGPISILVTSNALKGKRRFCNRTALGGGIVEFFYVLVAVYGMALLFSTYSSIIPYLFLIGGAFLLIVGIKVYASKLELKDIEKSGKEIKKSIDENKGGLRTGIIINLTNPSLFFGLLTSSFIVLSFSSSIGLNTGGLEFLLKENAESIQQLTNEPLDLDSTLAETLNIAKNDEQNATPTKPSSESPSTLVLSIVYALAIAFGGFLWLFFLTKLLIKYRQKINLNYLTWIIRGLAIILFGISAYLIWTAINIFIG